MRNDQRPYVELVFAMSADGKIADAARTPRRIASARDRAVWDGAMLRSDAVLYGAGTLRSVGRSLQTLELQQGAGSRADIRTNIVASVNGLLDPELPFFDEPYPKWLVCAEPPSRSVSAAFDKVIVSPSSIGPGVDWQSALKQISESGVNRLCCGGGGGLAAQLFKEGLIDEYLLTIAPLIVGGRTAPTPVDGEDLRLGSLPTLELVHQEVIDGEIFVRYRVVGAH